MNSAPDSSGKVVQFFFHRPKPLSEQVFGIEFSCKRGTVFSCVAVDIHQRDRHCWPDACGRCFAEFLLAGGAARGTKRARPGQAWCGARGLLRRISRRCRRKRYAWPGLRAAAASALCRLHLHGCVAKWVRDCVLSLLAAGGVADAFPAFCPCITAM